MRRYEVVVSTENNHYMVWQAMLFHYSCLTHLGQPPIVMVHNDGGPLLPGFERIRETGGIIQTAPSYRRLDGVFYPPRNTAGSLRHVQTNADHILLCDPDMIFLQPFQADDLITTDRHLSFDFVGYLDPDHAVYQPALDQVCRRIGFSPEKLRQPVVDGGVPHVIPTACQKRLSDEWFDLMGFFPDIAPASPGDIPRKDWLVTMWALVMAMHRLDLQPVMTRFCVTNCHSDLPMSPLDAAGPKILHYCYGGSGFDKRQFQSAAGADEAVWNVPPDDGTISGTIRRQLREARQFYGLS